MYHIVKTFGKGCSAAARRTKTKNHKCCDCDKIIEPDKELRFYPEQEISAAAERFLSEVCADFCAAAGRLEVDYRGLKSN